MRYACVCPSMRTFREDITSSTCKDCKARGAISLDDDGIPNCSTCKCVCVAGVFTMKEVNKLAGRRLEERELAARDERSSKNERMRDSLQSVIRSSLVDGFSALQSSSSRQDNVNLISSIAAAMSRKQFRSEEEMHEAQKAFPVTTKLKASGEDVRSVLRINQKGLREYRNKLGSVFCNLFLLLLFHLNTHYIL